MGYVILAVFWVLSAYKRVEPLNSRVPLEGILGLGSRSLGSYDGLNYGFSEGREVGLQYVMFCNADLCVGFLQCYTHLGQGEARVGVEFLVLELVYVRLLQCTQRSAGCSCW